jgi:hypothetical protein
MQPEIERLENILNNVYTRSPEPLYYSQQCVDFIKEIYTEKIVELIPPVIRMDIRFYSFLFQNEKKFNRNMGLLLDDMIFFGTDKHNNLSYKYCYVWNHMIQFLYDKLKYKNRKLFNEETIEKIQTCCVLLDKEKIQIQI